VGLASCQSDGTALGECINVWISWDDSQSQEEQQLSVTATWKHHRSYHSFLDTASVA